jgi:hypothetical protein
MPEFRRGAEEAEAAHEAAKGAGRAQFITIADKETVIFRLLTEIDQWIDCEVHMGVPTKKAPEGFKGQWPQAMSAVCQNDVMFRTMKDGDSPGRPTGAYEPGYGDCYIHEHMADVMGKFGRPVSKTSPTVWALCVVREAVRNPETKKITGFQDKMEEWTDDKGVKHRIPVVRILSQRFGNFFGAIKQSAYIEERVCHRDFYAKRDGNDYEITGLTPTPDHEPGTPSWKLYDQTLELTGFSLEKTIIEQSSPEYYARFFDPTKTAPDRSANGGDSGKAPPTEDTAAPSEELPEDELAAFKDRIDKSMGELGGSG